ncbi:hypothetical protein EMIT0P74_140174 [Pseudomonas sp. IT-P74]
MQVLRQCAQGIAAEVEHFQRIRQIEDLPGKLGQAFGQIQPRDARQLAGAQLSKGMHEQIRHLPRGGRGALEMGDMIAGKMWRLSGRLREQALPHLIGVDHKFCIRHKSSVGASLLAIAVCQAPSQ